MFAHKTDVPDDYSINLMWINKTINPNKPYITSSETENELIDKFLIRATKWQQANPEATVNIWYDSQFTTPEAVVNTQAVLDKIQPDLPNKVILKDVRQIEVVRNNPDLFSDNIPVYYRVDVMKFVICAHELQAEGKECAVLSDLDIGEKREDKGRMPKHQLFNTETMQRLDQYGIQFIYGGLNFENQFIQVLNKKETLQAINVFINVCLMHTVTALNLPRDAIRRKVICDLSPMVFYSISRLMTPYLYTLTLPSESVMVKADLREGEKSELVKYNPAEHGYLPFGNLYNAYTQCSYVCYGDTEHVGSAYSDLIFFSEKYKYHAKEFYRMDLDSRGGNHHDEAYQNLVERLPADGSETYKCRLIEIATPTQTLSPLLK